jgi:hypothetical protein
MGGKIKDELMGNCFMDIRLGYCREIPETAGGKYYPLSGLSPEALTSFYMVSKS